MHTDLPWPRLPRGFSRRGRVSVVPFLVRGEGGERGGVSPIPRANSKITPWAGGGHAQPPARSVFGVPSSCWLVGCDLLCAPALVSSPRRIELNRMFQVMYGAPPTLLSFTLAGILSKRLEDYAFAAAPSPVVALAMAGWGGGPVSRVCGQDYNGL